MSGSSFTLLLLFFAAFLSVPCDTNPCESISWPSVQCTEPSGPRTDVCQSVTSSPLEVTRDQRCVRCFDEGGSRFVPLLCPASTGPKLQLKRIHDDVREEVVPSATSFFLDVPARETKVVKLAVGEFGAEVYMNVALHFTPHEDVTNSVDGAKDVGARSRAEALVTRTSEDVGAEHRNQTGTQVEASPAAVDLNSEQLSSTSSQILSSKDEIREGCWYLRRSLAPMTQAGSSIFEYKVEGTGAVNLPQLSREDLYLRVEAGGQSQHVRVEAAISQVTSLPLEGLDVSFTQGSHVMLSFQPSQGFDAAVIFLSLTCLDGASPTVKVWSNINERATEANARYQETISNQSSNGLQTSSTLMLHRLGHSLATWTLISDANATCRVLPVSACSNPVSLDKTFNFQLSSRVQLFSFKPQSGLAGQAFVQLMPSTSDISSVRTYSSWQSLSAAVQIASYSTINKQTRIWPLSKWGYTADGVAGLQVEVDAWDPDTSVYVEVRMIGDSVPNDKFSMVIYHLGSVFELWKWWFGGTAFAIFVFCFFRCMFCKWIHGRMQGSLLNREQGVQAIGSHRVIRSGEEITTSKAPPTRMLRVSNVLYRRLEGTRGNIASCVNANVVFVASQETRKEDRSSHEALTSTGEEQGEGEEATDSLCCVCLDHASDAILLECGHGGVCVACATAIWDLGPARRHCPMCREAFIGVMRIEREEECDVEVRVVRYALSHPLVST